MPCLKFSIVAVILLALFASVQCVANCATMPCDRSSADLPPCHRHSSPAPKTCVNPLVVADIRAHSPASSTPTAPQAIIAASEPAAAIVLRPADRRHNVSPSFDTGGPSFTILRI